MLLAKHSSRFSPKDGETPEEVKDEAPEEVDDDEEDFDFEELCEEENEVPSRQGVQVARAKVSKRARPQSAKKKGSKSKRKEGPPSKPPSSGALGGVPKKPKKLGEKTGYEFKKGVDVDFRGTNKTLQDALDEGFRRTGVPKEEFKVTKWANDANGKSGPVEWKVASGPNRGAMVNIDIEHDYNGPDVSHVGYQTPGNSAIKGHILLDDVPRNRPFKESDFL